MGTEPSKPHANTPRTLTLSPGESTQLDDGSHLAYLKLLNDSRCPPNVQCIWAGNAEIQMRWTPADGGTEKAFTLNTSPVGGKPVSAQLGAFEVRIQLLERGSTPAATFELRHSELKDS